MTTTPSTVDEAEGLVRQLAAKLTGTHCHAVRFRDDSAPRATALRERLSRVGACCCDCELFMNGYELQQRFRTPQREVEEDGVVFVLDSEQPDQLPRWRFNCGARSCCQALCRRHDPPTVDGAAASSNRRNADDPSRWTCQPHIAPDNAALQRLQTPHWQRRSQSDSLLARVA